MAQIILLQQQASIIFWASFNQLSTGKQLIVFHCLICLLLSFFKIKDSVIKHMARVNVTDNIETLIQVASVVAGVTENQEELSQDSQVIDNWTFRL